MGPPARTRPLREQAERERGGQRGETPAVGRADARHAERFGNHHDRSIDEPEIVLAELLVQGGDAGLGSSDT